MAHNYCKNHSNRCFPLFEECSSIKMKFLNQSQWNSATRCKLVQLTSQVKLVPDYFKKILELSFSQYLVDCIAESRLASLEMSNSNGKCCHNTAVTMHDSGAALALIPNWDSVQVHFLVLATCNFYFGKWRLTGVFRHVCILCLQS